MISNNDFSEKLHVRLFLVISANALPVRYCHAKPIASVSSDPIFYGAVLIRQRHQMSLGGAQAVRYFAKAVKGYTCRF